MRDVPALVATQRAALAAQVSASVTAVLEHATAHLDSELALLCDGWRRAVAAATTVDELEGRGRPRRRRRGRSWRASPRTCACW
ncbi:MAG: hypothetical protein HS111_35900 [Kofleriaceae bacterium]|nr:hypothetical protein [Kofleriaceae bacterium]